MLSKNKEAAALLGYGFICYASHRFNLAAKDILSGYTANIDSVNTLMVKLRNMLPSARLRKHNPLKPLRRNVTRWSSTYAMLRRYQEMKEFVTKLGLEDVTVLMASSADAILIDRLRVQLGELDSVTKSLQLKTTTMSEVWVIFDADIEQFSDLYSRLSKDASIFMSPAFESAIVKVQDGRIGELLEDEPDSEKFAQIVNNSETIQDEHLSLAERSLQKHRADKNRCK